MESDQHSGRPQTVLKAAFAVRVENLIKGDRRLTVREIAEEVGISKDSAHQILRADLNMGTVAAKCVPKLLSAEQEKLLLQVAQDPLDTTTTDSEFLNTEITEDESFVRGDVPETKAQLSQWNHLVSYI